jgi:hypothetical protein
MVFKGANSLIKEPFTMKCKNVKVKKENVKDDMISNKKEGEKERNLKALVIF